MKAYKVEILIIDHDEIGADGIEAELENASYGNDCISPRVMDIEEVDIGEWDDSHPLNSSGSIQEAYEKLFKK